MVTTEKMADLAKQLRSAGFDDPLSNYCTIISYLQHDKVEPRVVKVDDVFLKDMVEADFSQRNIGDYHRSRLERLADAKAVIEDSEEGVWHVTRAIRDFWLNNRELADLARALVYQLPELQRHAARSHLEEDRYFALPLQDFRNVTDSPKWKTCFIQGLWGDDPAAVTKWGQIAFHSLTSFRFFGKEAASLINDHEEWTNSDEFPYPFVEQPYELGTQMLTYGLKNKHFFNSQPHKVVIKSGAIDSITVVDSPRGIVYKVKNREGRITFGGIQIEKGKPFYFFDSLDAVTDIDGMYQPRYAQFEEAGLGISSGIYPVVCAIARDMFVLEQRDARYHVKVQERRSGVRGQKRIKGYVWIPRERVEFHRQNHYATRIIEVAPHHVSGHPRKLPQGHKASQVQIDLAALAGKELEPGCTFVGEYNKGENTRDPVYRSRSALQVVFAPRT